MSLKGGIIETGVDKLVKIVKQRGKIALADAAIELGVGTSVIQEWVEFLEEEGIISVEYKLTKPYLVERKLTKKEVESKAKEFASKKDVFVRKAEVSLSFLEKQAKDLKKVKEEFDKLKNDLGMELDTVRNDLKELERYQQLKQDLQRQVEDQKSEMKTKIEEFSRQILREQKKYQDLVTNIKREREVLSKEKVEAVSIEKSEEILNQKLMDLKNMIGTIEKRISNEDISIKNSESHIKRLNQVIYEVKKQAEDEKSAIDPLVEKNKEQEKKIVELQNNIIKKIAKKHKDASDLNKMTKKVNDFFQKKLGVVNLVDKVNKDRDELEKNLIALIKRAKSFQLSAKSRDVGKEMVELEKKFNEVNKKKDIFEVELKKLASFFKR
ncbi:hypothetical protein CMO83_00510 [Candidatus Woesearchaeota archaeon]|jgi:chromosome segregation ATPase|nr:hypothetical protein [Candidatus Woesearchaeota archaeon]|tara:strand:- start:5468 stop:6613 length:1146 start_codon:yes stop_codon:yes gene_type:complete